MIIGLNSDESVRRIKGSQRPILTDSDRAAILGALDCVDLVVIFDEDTPLKLIDALKPDVLVKGADYRLEDVVGREIVESNGGRVHLVPVREGYSTTGLTEKNVSNLETVNEEVAYVYTNRRCRFYRQQHLSDVESDGLYRHSGRGQYRRSPKWKNLVGKSFRLYVHKNSLWSWLEEHNQESVEAVIHLGACTDTMEKNFDYLVENNVTYSQRLWQFCAQQTDSICIRQQCRHLR